VAVACSVVAGPALIGVSPSAAATDVSTTVAGGGTSTALTNGIPSTAASLGSPLSAVLDHSNNVVFADQNNNVIRVAAATTGTFYNVAMTAGHLYTVVGDPANTTGDDSGAALSISLSDPNGVAVDAAGDIAITDTGDEAVLFDPATSGTYFGQPMTAHVVYPIAGDLDPNGAISTYAFNAGLSSPDGIAFDAQGDVVVADTGNDIIRLIPRTAHTAFGQAMQPFSIYTIAGNTNYGYTGNGGPAVGAELGLDSFNGVAVDPRGDVVLSDVDNNVVRLVAASSGSAFGRSVTAGDIYTIAGTSKAGFKGDKKPATKAWLNSPQGVAVDAAGNLLISDSTNNRIRLVPAAKGTYDGMAVKAGDIYTIAGNGGTTELNAPTDVNVGPTGNLVVADNGNNVIREIAGTPPGQPTVSAIKPTSGPITGDRKVAITGANLGGTTAVLFGSRPALSFTVKSATKVIAYSPASTLGAVVIRVSSSTSSTVADAPYTYEPAAAKKHGPRR
jgi:sugar lactone lactonase YvrE